MADHIVVTGGSTGIGLATAKLLAGRGAKVSLIARSAEKLDAAVAEIGEAARAFPADAGDNAALIAALEAASAALGPIDGLFANAGTGGKFGPVQHYADEDFEAVLAVNLIGPFRAIKHVLPGMIHRRRGAILVTGSLASHRGMPMNAAYVASKHGVLGLARAVAAEAAPHGVRVNCIIPGFIETRAARGARQVHRPRLHRDADAGRPAARRDGAPSRHRAPAAHRHGGGSGRGRRLPALRRGEPCHRPKLVGGRRHAWHARSKPLGE
jgi:NAD(P)-dependent dehydrogenase (short-subunit alcohol dehydrogenase family)